MWFVDDVREADCRFAPDVWRRAGKGKLERRQVWSSKVRSKQQQVPEAGSDDEKVLAEVSKLSPAEFEAFNRCPHRQAAGNSSRPSAPGDEDKTHPRSRARLFWHVQDVHTLSTTRSSSSAKRRGTRRPITPDQVSRLVARLGRGQYGLYFTTSWYSKQTQKEIEGRQIPRAALLRPGYCEHPSGWWLCFR